MCPRWDANILDTIGALDKGPSASRLKFSAFSLQLRRRVRRRRFSKTRGRLNGGAEAENRSVPGPRSYGRWRAAAGRRSRPGSSDSVPEGKPTEKDDPPSAARRRQRFELLEHRLDREIAVVDQHLLGHAALQQPQAHLVFRSGVVAVDRKEGESHRPGRPLQQGSVEVRARDRVAVAGADHGVDLGRTLLVRPVEHSAGKYLVAGIG